MQQLQHQQQKEQPSQLLVRGPIFVSIGTVEQLSMFLEKNPKIPRDQILVDDYDHKSYKDTMGFQKFDEIKSLNQLKGLELKKLLLPLVNVLGISNLWTYVRNVPKLAPIEGDLDWTNLPEGGLRNGGTVVISSGQREDEIIYRWNDKIPGDVPNPSDVYNEIVVSLPIKNGK